MKRNIILGAAFGLLLPATAIAQGDQAQSSQADQAAAQQSAPLEIPVQGVDDQRGPFEGQMTITPQEDGTVQVDRQVTFADGTSQAMAGTGQVQGESIQAELQAPQGGLAGAISPSQSSAPEQAEVKIDLDAEQGTVQSEGRSLMSRFRDAGRVAADRVRSFFGALSNNPVFRPVSAFRAMRDRVSGWIVNLREKLRARRAAQKAEQAAAEQAAPAASQAAPASSQAASDQASDQASAGQALPLPTLDQELGAPQQAASGQQQTAQAE